ncbi:MAG: rod shape-determining protein RodA [Bacteroidaceae bacterium]|nr:rod shape-determining protein RodA [Bacteroidaceae bacterium]
MEKQQGRTKGKSIVGSIDWLTILIYAILLAMGWMSICGASYDYGSSTSLLDPSTRSGMQVVWIASSMLLGGLILLLDDRLFDTFAYLIYAALLALLFVTPFLAHDIKGSHSWIKIGSFSLQSAEFAKFATSLAVAKFMSSYGFQLQGSLKNFVVCFLLIAMPMALIVMQRETGSALVYTSFFLMLYREGMPGSILFAGVSAVIYFVVGIRFAEDMVIGGTTSLGVFAVEALILVFLIGMVVVYTRPSVVYGSHSSGETHSSSKAYRSTMLVMCLMGICGMGIAVVVSKYIFPFDVTLVQGVLIGIIVLYLLYTAIASHIIRYFYIAMFAIGSMAFFFSAHTILYKVLEPHQQKRVLVLLGLQDDPKGTGYNVIQAQIAIGSGGLEGKGFLNGTQTKLKYVPEQETDFIFCTVGEEQGFIGSAAVLGLFLLLLLRIIYVSERQPYAFGRVYGYCVFSIFLFHILINVGMVLGLMPVIGIPLPFFSYGGSSLWGFTLLLFIFLRIDAGRNRMLR